MKKLRVNVVQLDAGLDRQDNLDRIAKLVDSGPQTDLVALPEVFTVRGTHCDYLQEAEPVPGPTIEFLSGLALAHNSWVLGGSIIERADDTLYNTLVLMDRSGTLVSTYRKIHLFEATLDNGQVICEEETYSAGAEPVMADIDGWSCGLSICYDIRFPELYRGYSRLGSHLFLVPANFTQRTGRDHWEVLLRSRAIENQCFVVAPNQCGPNQRTGVASHGHSMVVDPWGQVLSVTGDEEGLVCAELDFELLASVRGRIPVLDHRRLG